ncbi:hypothetical protein [Leeuwenhoekiella aestuarii]|uniref:Uncharacterized protein n=1 Tax=Leeuwenhoekiella aestuarii TaxID=2249426 RepID=A0A4V1KPV2_9FLAO|nr:hypothetical protein [Leeuwenhoekiella aestuarii]RXG17982.1 hypothetical protein DSM04_101168 [Leeuwenhoekiella aestuarii]
MKKDEIIRSLTPEQREEFENDIQNLYAECHKALNGKMEKLKDVVVNLNLNNEVYLRVVCAYDATNSSKVKGKITELHKYKNEQEYKQALAIERASLN